MPMIRSSGEMEEKSSGRSSSSNRPPTPWPSACESFFITTDPRNTTTYITYTTSLRHHAHHLTTLATVDEVSMGPWNHKIKVEGANDHQIVSDCFRSFQIVSDRSDPILFVKFQLVNNNFFYYYYYYYY